MLSKKATKIDKILTVDLTLCSKCQIHFSFWTIVKSSVKSTVKILSIFVAFLKNMNFTAGSWEKDIAAQTSTVKSWAVACLD